MASLADALHRYTSNTSPKAQGSEWELANYMRRVDETAHAAQSQEPIHDASPPVPYMAGPRISANVSDVTHRNNYWDRIADGHRFRPQEVRMYDALLERLPSDMRRFPGYSDNAMDYINLASALTRNPAMTPPHPPLISASWQDPDYSKPETSAVENARSLVQLILRNRQYNNRIGQGRLELPEDYKIK